MASVTWPPLVTAAPISSSVKVARARPGTAAAMRPMRVARMGGTGRAVVDIGREWTRWRSINPTVVIGSLRHARRPDHPQVHPRPPVRPGRARAGALPRRRLQPGRPALRRAAGAPAADRRGRRGRPALPLTPWRLGASGRLRGGRHAARPRPRTPQRQPVLPGTSSDLLLSSGAQPANAQPQTSFPVNFRKVIKSIKGKDLLDAGVVEMRNFVAHSKQISTENDNSHIMYVKCSADFVVSKPFMVLAGDTSKPLISIGNGGQLNYIVQ